MERGTEKEKDKERNTERHDADCFSAPYALVVELFKLSHTGAVAFAGREGRL